MIRSPGLKAFACTCLLALIQAAMAYEPDTHFQMTYVICRVAGFSAPEALQIASADQGMDDSPDCLANGGIGGVIPNVRQEWLWHAFDHDGKMGAKGVLDRKERMFHAAETAPGHPLQLLGVFFHYQQDTWAHRHHYDKENLSYANWTTYNTPFGHAKDVHQPDRPPFDPVCALICAEDMLRYAHSYLVDVLHRPQGRFLTNYVPSQETTQAGWSENNPYFHQLAINGAAGSPRHFLIDLIRTQIAAYSKSVDPRWELHKTSDIADGGKITERLNWCCNLYRAQLGPDLPVVPEVGVRFSQHFDHMTTDGLIKMGLPGN